MIVVMNHNEPLNLEVPPAFLMGVQKQPNNSPVPRPRKEGGDRVPVTSVYTIPTAGREPLDTSKYPELIAQIEPHFPVYASKLLHDYHDKLIPAGRDVDKAYDLAHAELA